MLAKENRIIFLFIYLVGFAFQFNFMTLHDFLYGRSYITEPGINACSSDSGLGCLEDEGYTVRHMLKISSYQGTTSLTALTSGSNLSLNVIVHAQSMMRPLM